MAVKMGVDLPDVMLVPSLKGAVGGEEQRIPRITAASVHH